jgi:hypothetical protein
VVCVNSRFLLLLSLSLSLSRLFLLIKLALGRVLKLVAALLVCCDQLEIFSTDVKIETKQQSALLMFPPSKRKENQAVKLLFLFLSTSLSFPIRKK